MNKTTEIFKSHHVQIALLSVISIILIALFSKWDLEKPINLLVLLVPVLIELAYEYIVTKHSESKIASFWIWVSLILLVTLIFILASWI